MEEETRIDNGVKLPPKKRIVLRQTKSLLTSKSQAPTMEDRPTVGTGTSDANQSDSTSPIHHTVPKTYEEHPSWKSWRGRMSRLEFVVFTLFKVPLIAAELYIGTFVIAYILGAIGVSVLGGLFGIVSWVLIPFYLEFVRICGRIRRFHDLGQSGLRFFAFEFGQIVFSVALISLVITLKGSWTLDWIVTEFRTVPWWLILLGVILVILNLIVFVFLGGTRGPNKYGPDPTGQFSSKTGDLAGLSQRTKQLQELVAMKAAGHISESEYEERRARVLRGE